HTSRHCLPSTPSLRPAPISTRSECSPSCAITKRTPRPARAGTRNSRATSVIKPTVRDSGTTVPPIQRGQRGVETAGPRRKKAAEREGTGGEKEEERPHSRLSDAQGPRLLS